MHTVACRPGSGRRRCPLFNSIFVTISLAKANKFLRFGGRDGSSGPFAVCTITLAYTHSESEPTAVPHPLCLIPRCRSAYFSPGLFTRRRGTIYTFRLPFPQKKKYIWNKINGKPINSQKAGRPPHNSSSSLIDEWVGSKSEKWEIRGKNPTTREKSQIYCLFWTRAVIMVSFVGCSNRITNEM